MEPGLQRAGRLSPTPDGTTVYRTSRWRTFFFLLLSLAFCAGGLLMVRDGDARGWLVLVFFGLGVLVFAFLMMVRQQLTLTPEGIAMARPFRSDWLLRWQDIEAIKPTRVSRQPGVGFNRVGSFPPDAAWRALNRSLAGIDYFIATRLYGVKPEELAAVMQRYWLQARAAPPAAKAATILS
jgi:hypothetical protein